MDKFASHTIILLIVGFTFIKKTMILWNLSNQQGLSSITPVSTFSSIMEKVELQQTGGV